MRGAKALFIILGTPNAENQLVLSPDCLPVMHMTTNSSSFIICDARFAITRILDCSHAATQMTQSLTCGFRVSSHTGQPGQIF